MRAETGSGAAWALTAEPSAVGQMRRRAAAFASAAGASGEVSKAVALAVSETVTNAVIHAYAGREPGPVTVRCQADEDRLVVEVADEGAGIAARPDSPVSARASRWSVRSRGRWRSRRARTDRARS